jgi:hypothetical protein
VGRRGGRCKPTANGGLLLLLLLCLLLAACCLLLAPAPAYSMVVSHAFYWLMRLDARYWHLTHASIVASSGWCVCAYVWPAAEAWLASPMPARVAKPKPGLA